jgi:glycine betaine catabolism B
VLTVTRQAPPTWTRRRGRIDLGMLRPLIGPSAPLCFLCGPPTMVDDVTHLLSQLGVPADHVRTEQWSPAV